MGAEPAELAGAILGGEWVVAHRVGLAGGVELELHRALAPRITSRQSAILAAAASGRSGKEIAITLGIQESTVATHVATALARIGLSRSELGNLLGVLSAAPGGQPGGVQLRRDGAREVLAARLSWAEQVPASSLTAAETEVVVAALSGMSNREIAARRRRSRRTIANQLGAAFRKLRVGSRGELFAMTPRAAS